MEMNKRFIGFALLFLTLTLPFSSLNVYAQTGDPRNDQSIFGSRFTGEAIDIYVDYYEPTVLTSNLIEEDNVPVFAFLKANTLGSLLGQDDANFEPLYGAPKIRAIVPTRVEPKDALVGNPFYIRPRLQGDNFLDAISPSYSIDNLGTMVLMLKRIPREADVPDVINVNISVRVFYDVERTLSFGRETLRLDENRDFSLWRGQTEQYFPYLGLVPYTGVGPIGPAITSQFSRLETQRVTSSVATGSLSGPQSCFFNGIGCVRALEIKNSEATFEVYNGELKSIGVPVNLKIGETSRRTFSLGGIYSYLSGNQVKLRLDDIIDKNERRVLLEIRKGDGRVERRSLRIGDPLYEGSWYRIGDIDKSESGNVRQTVRLDLIDKGALNRFFDNLNEAGKAYLFDLFGIFTNAGDFVETFRSVTLEKKYNLEPLEVDKDIFLDPCDDYGEDTGIKDNYCNAIDEFRQVTSLYGNVFDKDGELWSDKAYCKIGESYEELAKLLGENNNAAKFFALDAYTRIQNKESCIEEGSVDARINELDISLRYDVQALSKIIYDNNQEVRIRLTDVEGNFDNLESNLVFVVNGEEQNLRVGSKIGNSNWVVERFGVNSVTFVKVIKGEEERETISLGEIIKLEEDTEVTLTKVINQRQALVTIIPFTENAVSETSFTIRIPIEKRAFNLTLEKIDESIDKTQDLIDKLEDIIERMERLVTSWKKVCIVTFGFLTIKNLFSGVSGARTAIMRGPDGRSGWSQYCERNSGPGAVYSTFDKCIFDNEGEINKAISNFDKTLDDYNSDLKSTKDVTQTRFYKGLELPEGIDDKDRRLILSDEDIKRYIYLDSVRGNRPDSFADRNEKEANALQTYYDNIDKEFNLLNETIGINSNAYTDAIKGLELAGLNPGTAEYQREFRNAFISFTDKETGIDEGTLIQDLFTKYKIDGSFRTLKDVGILKDVDRDAGTAFSFGKEDGEVFGKKIEGLTPVKYLDLTFAGEKGQEIFSIETKDKKLDVSLAGEEILYRDNKGNYYKVARESVDNNERKDFSPNIKADYYPSGRPYLLPYKDGNYIKITGYKSNGDIDLSEVNVWNVGNDGLMETGDTGEDLKYHSTELSIPPTKEIRAVRNDIISYINNNYNKEEGESIKTRDGDRLGVVYSAARSAINIAKPHCTDVMGITDCKILFNVCDPVMCPASRFNLGGRWQVNNVVRTGIIGSLVLGLPNWGADQPVPPICMTGILAGLKNIRSIFQGYQSCLNEAKVTGRSVGICDRIRSVFMCEILWREALAILDVNNGLLSWILDSGNKVSGGGEYINFKSALDNAGDGVSFFVNDYGRNAFTAYRARSLGEFGAEICKAAIYSKIPGTGDFFDQLAQPEDPPQFTAVFSTKPYSTTSNLCAGQPCVSYSVYYHIYAGRDANYYNSLAGVNYKVFLRNSQTGLSYPVTDRCGVSRTLNLAPETFADRNIDCAAVPAGMNEICVELNGITECGFGKVSSEFALNFVYDSVIARELNKDIEKEDECVPDARFGSSVASTFAPGFDTAVGGISRICSNNNPDAGTGKDYWRKIGSCGEDDRGRGLGSCWLDTRTISAQTLNRLNPEIPVEEVVYNEEEARAALDGIDLMLRQGASSAEINAFIEDQLSESSHKAEAVYLIGLNFFNKAKTLLRIRENIILGGLEPEVQSDIEFDVGLPKETPNIPSATEEQTTEEQTTEEQTTEETELERIDLTQIRNDVNEINGIINTPFYSPIDSNRLFEILENRNKEQINLIKQQYEIITRVDLGEDLINFQRMDEDNVIKALNLLGEGAKGDAWLLSKAINRGFFYLYTPGTEAIFEILEGKSPDRIDRIEREFLSLTGETLKNSLESNLSGSDLERALSLLERTPSIEEQPIQETFTRDKLIQLVRDAAVNLIIDPDEAEALLRTENAQIDPLERSSDGTSIGLLQVQDISEDDVGLFQLEDLPPFGIGKDEIGEKTIAIAAINFERYTRVEGELMRKGIDILKVESIDQLDLTNPEINVYVGLDIYRSGIRQSLLPTGFNSVDYRYAYYNGGPNAVKISRDCLPGQDDLPTDVPPLNFWFAYECPWDDVAHTIDNTGYEETRIGIKNMKRNLDIIKRNNAK